MIEIIILLIVGGSILGAVAWAGAKINSAENEQDLRQDAEKRMEKYEAGFEAREQTDRDVQAVDDHWDSISDQLRPGQGDRPTS